jgi:hypothetical protein
MHEARLPTQPYGSPNVAWMSDGAPVKGESERMSDEGVNEYVLKIIILLR